MDNKVRIIGKKSSSHIAITESGVYIISNKKALNPLGIVTITGGIQVELGRGIEEFRKCLKEVRRPLGVQKLAEMRGQATYRIIRLATGKVPEVILCNISTLNGIIAGVAFNQDVVYNTDYTAYERLSVIHQLRAGKPTEIGVLSKAVRYIAKITGEPIESFKMRVTSKTIVVYTDISELTNQYKYTFSLDKGGYFNLLSVAFLAKKLSK